MALVYEGSSRKRWCDTAEGPSRIDVPVSALLRSLGARGVFADVERVAGAPGISSAGTGCHSAASYLNTKPRANKQGTMRTTKVE